MPTLERIVIQDFRNIGLQELHFSPKINCISGGNGEGKTNLLDAIWYLSMTKSATGSSDRFNFRHGCDSFSIMGSYKMPSGTNSKFSISVSSSGEKRLKKDDKPYDKLSSHIGILPIVMVSPADTALISESGEERRRFVNLVLSQLDREYMSTLQQYNRLLLQRNRLLKEGSADEDYLDVLDQRMEDLSEPIFRSRQLFCKNILPCAQEYYQRISAECEQIDIQYRSDLDKAPLSELLKSSRERDRMIKYTGYGIQRDDFIFSLNSMPIRYCGSQGQQKSFLVSLKFSQYDIMGKQGLAAPTLLLDDLFDKLDPKRIENLLSIVSDRNFGQIFLTDPDMARTKSIVDSITSQRAYFIAEKGAFREDGQTE